MKPKRLLLAFLCFGVFTQETFAASCCEQILKSISEMESGIIAQLIKNAKDHNTGLNAIVSTVAQSNEKAAKAIIDALWEIHRRDVERKVRQRKVDLYYNGGVPVDQCDTVNRGKKIYDTTKSASETAKEASKEIGRSTRVGGGGDRKTGPEEIRRVLELVKSEKMTDVGENLFSPETSFDEKKQQIELLLTFVPPADINESLKENTSAGKMFQMLSEEYKLRLSALREVLLEAAKYTSREGSDKSMKELVDEYLERESYMSEPWRIRVARLNQTELLREMNTQLAFGAMLEKRLMDLETKSAVAEAQVNAYRIDAEFKENLNVRRAQAQAQR